MSDSDVVVCEAKAMARDVLDTYDLDPCFDEATVLVEGFMLCKDCVWALKTIVKMAKVMCAK